MKWNFECARVRRDYLHLRFIRRRICFVGLPGEASGTADTPVIALHRLDRLVAVALVLGHQSAIAGGDLPRQPAPTSLKDDSNLTPVRKQPNAVQQPGRNLGPAV
jgi:hypothetical protein